MRIGRRVLDKIPQRVREPWSDPAQRPRMVRLTVGSVVAVAALTGLLALVGPTLASGGPAAWMVGGVGSWMVPGSVSARRVGVGWLSGLDITGLAVDDPAGSPVLRVKSVRVNGGGLAGLALGGRDLGDVHVTGVRLSVQRYDDGTTNLQRALVDPEAEPWTGPLSIPPSLRAELALSDARVTLAAMGLEPIRVALTARARVDGGRSFTSHLEADITQGPGESEDDDENAPSPPPRAGRLVLDAAATDYADADGLIHPTLARVDIDGQLESLDLAAIDRALGRRDLLSTVLGPTLTGRLTVRGRLSRLSLRLWGQSKTLRADAGLKYDGSAVVAAPDSAIRFRLTPEAWARLVGRGKTEGGSRKAERGTSGGTSGGGPELVEPVEVQAKLAGFRLGSNALGLPVLRGTKLDLDLTAGDLVVRLPGSEATSELTGFRARLTSDGIGQGIRLSSGFTVKRGRDTGGFKLTGEVNDLLDAEDRLSLTAVHGGAALELTDLDLAALGQILGVPGRLAPVLGAKLAGSGKLTVNPAKNATEEDPRWTLAGDLDLHADRLALTGRLHGDADRAGLHLVEPTGLDVRLVPGLVRGLLLPPDADAQAQAPARLAEPATITLALERGEAPWSGSSPSVTGGVTADVIELTGKSIGRVALRGLSMRFDEVMLGRTVSAQMKGQLVLDGQPAPLTGSLTLSPGDGLLGWGHAAGKLGLKRVPMGYLGRIAGVGLAPAMVLGPGIDTVDGTLGVDLAHPLTGAQFTAKVRSPSLGLDLSGRLAEGGRLVVDPGEVLRVRILPGILQTLAALGGAPGLEMSDPAELVVKVNRAEAGLVDAETGAVRPDPTDVGLDVSLTMADVDVTEPTTGRTFGIHGLGFEAKSSDLTGRVTLGGGFKFSDTAEGGAEGPGAGPGAGPGEVRTQTTAEHLVTPGLEVQLDRARVKSTTRVSMPLALIDAAWVQNTRLVQALGGRADLDLDVSLSPGEAGKARFTLKTPRAVDIELTADQPEAGQPFAWQLAAEAQPVLLRGRAHGTFDPSSLVLTLDRYESRTLVTSRRQTGILAALPKALSQQVADSRLAIEAALKMKDGRLPLRDWRAMSLQLLFTADSTVAYYHGKLVPIGRSLARVTVGGRVANLDQLAINAMDGHISLVGSTSLADERFESTYRLDLTKLNANAAIALLYPPDTLAGQTRGTINGVVRLNGPLADITQQADGDGDIRVTDGVLDPLPVISDILRFLRVSNLLRTTGLSPDDVPNRGTDSAHIVFDFAGDHAQFKQTDVKTDVVDLTGNGRVGFDQSVDLSLFVNVIGKWARKKIKVTGTVNSPEINPF